MRVAGILLLLAVKGLTFQESGTVLASKQAKEAMLAGRYQEAARLYKRLLEEMPNNAGIALNLGLAYFSAGQYSESLPYFERCVSLAPKAENAREFLNRARYETASGYLIRGDARKALQLLEQLPDSARKFFGLGKTYSALSRQTYEELERTEPDSPYRFALLARARFDQGQDRSALQLYREALKRDPAIPGIHTAISEIYHRTGFPDWAEAELKKERGGRVTDTRYAQAIAFSEQAAAAFVRLLSLPPSPESAEVQAESLWLTGKRKEAIESLEKVTRTPRLERQLIRYLWTMREFERVKPKLIKLLQTMPNDPEFNYWLGELLLESAGAEAAIPNLRKAVSILPARAALGRAYSQSNHHDEALPHLRASLSIDEDGSIHYLLSRALLALGQEAEAQAMLQKRSELITKNEAREREARGLEITPP